MGTQTTVTITLDPSIRRAVAERVVYENHPGYNSMTLGRGWTDGKELWVREANAPWDPWPDGTEVARVVDFVEPGTECSPIFEQVSGWKDAYPDQWAAWEAAFRQDSGLGNADPATEYLYDSSFLDDVLAYARQQHQQEVSAILDEQEAMAVDFVAGELAESIDIERDDNGYEEVVKRHF